MEITIKFSTDNAAFEDDFDGEVDYVMERAAQLVKEHDSFKLQDSNGNTIGTVEVK